MVQYFLHLAAHAASRIINVLNDRGRPDRTGNNWFEVITFGPSTVMSLRSGHIFVSGLLMQ